MDKYTNLEQALCDASLAIISDQITTPQELTKVYLKYRVLTGKQKRYSNYYSCKFLGHTVPEMYVLKKDQLNPPNDVFAGVQLPGEKYAVTEPDLYYKEDSFNKGETNICFILGHSGSGKSSMARMLEAQEIDHIELDDLLLVKDHFTFEQLKNYSDMFYAFFQGEGARYYIGLAERNSIPKEEYEDRVFTDFVRFAFTFAKQHPEKKYIIEGIWIYLYFNDPSVFDDYAVFIKGTSFLKSKIRTMKRERTRSKEELENRKQMFGREVRNYLLDEDKIDIYRSYFGSLPGTVFREETNEPDKKQQEMIRELNSIDSCFVHDDADGIYEILSRAEASSDMTPWDKLRITNECKLALFDLSLAQVPGIDLGKLNLNNLPLNGHSNKQV